MLENPTGPSSTTSICPRRIPLGKFENNTVHSQGWFALWIHESFFPTTTGACPSSKWDKAVFRKLTAWNNNKGPECVNCGGVQFEDMLLVNNDEAAIEGKRLMNGNLYDQITGPVYRNSTIVAFEPDLTDGIPDCHTRAVILPWAPGLTVDNMVMRNFNGQNCTAIHGTLITCLCNKLCGGYEYLFKNIKWENTNNRAEFRWHGDFSLRDVDGSLTDGIPNVSKLPGSLIIGKANHLPPEKCGPSAPGAGDLGTAFGQGAVQGVRCLPDVTALRFSVDYTNPAGLTGGNMTVTLLNGGTEQVPFKTEALTDKQGWMTTLINNRTYIVNWNAISTFTNLSYVGYLENFRQFDYVIVRHTGMQVKPDRVQVIAGQTPKQPMSEPLDPTIHSNGDIFYNETGKYVEYIVKAPVYPSAFNSQRLVVSFYKCFYTDCIVPSTSTVITVDTLRPANALYWSKSTTWGDILGPQPTNGSSGQSVLQAPKTVDEFMPNVMTDSAGTNYYDDSNQMLYVILKGEAIITVKLSQLVKVSFGLPAMTVDQFFGSEVVSNLAKFLGIPAENIRVVKVVSESSTVSGRRRRRSTSGVFVELEISSPPVGNLSKALVPNVTSSGMTLMEKISSTVVTIVQTGLLEKVINATVVDVSVQKPTPLPGSALWAAQVSGTSNNSQTPAVIQVPVKAKIKLNVLPGYGSVVEGVPFNLEVSTLDSSGNTVRPLGSNTSIWAYELSQPNAVSPVKVSRTNFSDSESGTALISNLIFSRAGQANLFLSVISPNDSTRLNSSVNFLVQKRQLSLAVQPIQSYSDDSIIKVSVNRNIPIQVKILDKQTNLLAQNLNWRNLVWNFTGSICPDSRKPKNSATNASSSFLYYPNKTTNGFNWTIGGFQSSWVYVYCIGATAYLNDTTTRQPDYDIIPKKIKIQVNPQNYTEPSRNAKKPFRFKTTGSYANMLQHIDEFTAAVESELYTRFPNVVFENITFSEGSIMVDAVAAGSSTTVMENMMNTFTSSLSDGSITFSVGGVNYTATADGKNAGCRRTGFISPFIMLLFNLLTYQLVLIILSY
ncbi:unnamed protein product [Heterobilharzia americana]|nr:unnamed protein product [Heterobilharzia americana]